MVPGISLKEWLNVSLTHVPITKKSKKCVQTNCYKMHASSLKSLREAHDEPKTEIIML